MSLFGSIGVVQSSDFSHGLFKVSSPPGGFTFSGSVSKSGISAQWTFGTYSFVSGNNVSLFLPGGIEYDLRLSVVDPRQMSGTSILVSQMGLTGVSDMRDFEDSTGVNLSGNPIKDVRFPQTDRDYSVVMGDCDIQGVVDLTMVTNLSGVCRFENNTGLTGIYHTFSSRPITAYFLPICDLQGELNLPFSDMGGDFRVQQNNNLTRINHHFTNRPFTIYLANNCNLQGVHDMSMLPQFTNNMRLGANPGLTGITHTFSNTVITEYWINSCNLEGILDVSMFPNMMGGFWVGYNPNLTGILHTASNQTFSYYFAEDCGLTGTHDLSMFPNFGGEFRIQNNPLLTEIVHTFSTVGFNQYNAAGCSLDSPRVEMLSNLTSLDTGTLLWTWADNGMGVTAVNQLLVDIDTVSVTASVTKTIDVSGTNATPTSGPPDGSAAVTSLLSKGFTVITS
jgi:hypothetical protein